MCIRDSFEGLGGGLGESEVDGAREELLRAVDFPRRQQFLRANHSQRGALLRSDEILAAFAASQRKIRGAHVASAREVREHRRLLVVRMGGDHEDRAEVVQPGERLFHFDGAGERHILLRRNGRQGE